MRIGKLVATCQVNIWDMKMLQLAYRQGRARDLREAGLKHCLWVAKQSVFVGIDSRGIHVGTPVCLEKVCHRVSDERE